MHGKPGAAPLVLDTLTTTARLCVRAHSPSSRRQARSPLRIIACEHTRMSTHTAAISANSAPLLPVSTECKLTRTTISNATARDQRPFLLVLLDASLALIGSQ